jgi:hypothetical protein
MWPLQIISQAPAMDFPLAATAASSPKFSADHYQNGGVLLVF